MQNSTLLKTRKSLRYISIAAALGWTIAAITVLAWEIVDNYDFEAANALAICRASYQKDLAFRRWAAKHGGAYVPATAETPPNPHLNVPERDIETPSGRKLTLMNPAYMTRQVYELMRSAPDSPQGHITSLNPIRPENAPDAWERKALEIIGGGTPEFSEYQEIDGVRNFRFMHVLKTEQPCLKCHAIQGYREGDVRGGISVSVPVTQLDSLMHFSNVKHVLIVGFVWCLGLSGIWLSTRIIGRGARALSDSEERYRQQFRQCQAAMLIIDPENGAIIDANPAACSFYGYACDTLMTRNISDINTSTPDELATCISEVRDGIRGQFVAQHRLVDGTIRAVEVFSNPIDFQGHTVLQSIVFDISDRLAAEKELRDKMDFAENLILNSTTPTFVINFDHQVLIWNRALEELTGIKAQEVVGTNEQWRAFYPDVRPCLADIVLDGSAEQARKLYTIISRSVLLPDGLSAEGDYCLGGHQCRLVFSAAPIRDRDGAVIAAIQTLSDVSERVSLGAQLLQAQKMESVGVLAGGIAHDFNNILTVINGYANLLQTTLAADEENLGYAQEITYSVDRAAEMTRSLLSFSGKQEMQKQYDDLNQICTPLRKSLKRLIREDITLDIIPNENRLPIYADRVQIEQVLINLVINARDALEAGGTITVSAQMAQYEEARREGNIFVPPGDYACLSISDNGSGMSEETIEHIFDPFFTTKEKGKGTGLGLAIVHSIVMKHNGHISVTSAKGKGTEFRVYLPLYAGDMARISLETVETVNPSGTETILIVEDDVAIMKMYTEVLDRYGYTILQAADGVEGMEVFTEHRDEIQLAIVDVIMPRMNGREVVEKIRQQLPKLPIIMISGYLDDIIDVAEIHGLEVEFLQKPLKPLDLLTAIRTGIGKKVAG